MYVYLAACALHDSRSLVCCIFCYPQSENIPNFRGTDSAIVKGIPRNVRPGYYAEMFSCYGVCSNLSVSSENDTYCRMPKHEESKFRTYVQQRRQYPPCIRIGVLACFSSARALSAILLHFYLFFHLNRAFAEDCCCCRSNKLIHKKFSESKKLMTSCTWFTALFGTCFQHFMSTLSKDLSDSSKEERISRACNKSRPTRREAFCIFPAFPPLCQRSW